MRILQSFPSGRLLVAFVVLLTTINLTPAAWGQNSTASVVGSVADPSGAKVADARLVLTNAETNVTRVTISNKTGDFNFFGVPPAHYKLTISAPGFETQKINTFDVAVAQSVEINVAMKIGEAGASVTVDAVGTQVETTTSQLGTVIGTKEVNDLPLNGRNFTQLLVLTPGASPVNVGQNSSSGNTANYQNDQYVIPAVNGQSSRSNLFLVDGLNDNNSWYNTYSVPPIIDTIQEFKINTHNDAQYGQVTGGVINVVSKAGTNTLHGSAWEFLRNNDFDAPTRFVSASNLYHQNQFGAQSGGPIVIPHVYNGRNKTFFEVGFEGFHYSKASQSYYLQPTAAQLGESKWGGPQDLPYADFSPASTGCKVGGAALTTSPCQLYDPTGKHNATSNRPYYPNNQIPVSELDPHAVALVNAIFGPPTTLPGIAPTTYNGIISTPTRQAIYNYTGRLDQHIGNSDFLFFRYAGWQQNTSGGSSIPNLFTSSILNAQQYGASWTHIFGPTISMQVQYGRNHVEYDTITQFSIKDPVGLYGVDPSFSSFVGGATLLTSLSISNGFSGGEVNSPSANEDNTHEFLGSVVKTFGHHTIQFGGGWDQVNYGQLIRQGSTTFSGASTANFLIGSKTPNPGSPAGTTQMIASSQTGFGLADFLLDEPNSATKRNVNVSLRIGGIASAYVQDNWRMTSRLTANIGLRYDRPVWPQYGTEASVGQQGSIETGDFDFNTGNYILIKLPPLCSDRGHAPCLPSATLPPHVLVSANEKIIHGSKLNIGPRLGLAYRVNDNMSIRGGFGITYDDWSGITQLAQNFQGSWPDIGTLASQGLNTPGSASYTSAQNPFGTSSGFFPAATPFASSNVNYFVDPRIKNPYSEQWNVGIEQQFGRFTVFALNYVGSQSHRLDIGGYYNTGTLSPVSFATRQAQYNANPSAYSNGAGNNPTGQPFPYIIPNKWDHAAGSGSYNSLQASLTRHASSGLVYNVAYTWAKAIDEGMSELFYAGTGASLSDPYNPRGSRGPAGFNVPQQLTVGLTYDLPFGKGRQFSTHNSFADYVVGNWELGTIYILRSGQNFSVVTAGDVGNTGNANTYERANIVGNPYQAGPIAANPGCSAPATVRDAAHWFNPCAFMSPQIGTLGDSGRNSMQAETYNNMDVSIFRRFPIWEALNLTLRADAFNVMNHPTLGIPANGTTNTTSLGVINGVASGSNQRILQFSAKMQF